MPPLTRSPDTPPLTSPARSPAAFTLSQLWNPRIRISLARSTPNLTLSLSILLPNRPATLPCTKLLHFPRRRSPPPPAPSCTVAAAPRDGNRRSRPPDSSPPPNFIFSAHPPSHGLGPSFGLCRSNPADSAQPALPSPAETIRPVPPPLGFGPEHATRFASRFSPAPTPSSVRPCSRPNAPYRGPTPAHSAQPTRTAQTFALPAQLTGPAPLCSRSALFRPPGPV
ncbi:hypothetical protein CRG98_022026 [Punica granatum]|uniref:Uncharacterized protein n=1 Tax=Punica granatum TaxID=22663 RepID=A0A2I0JMP7_PUNGR|nr:hypothetical protein CRG98_022026 [Punica granatum]